MAKEFELLVKLQAALGSNFKGAFQSAKGATQTLDKEVNKLNSTAKNIDGHNRLANQLENSKEKLKEQTKVLEDLKSKLKESGGANEKLTEKVRKQDAAVAKTAEKIKKETEELDRLKDKLAEAGVNTNRLSEEKAKLSKKIEEVSKANNKLKDIGALQNENKEKIKSTTKELLLTKAAIAGIYTATMVAANKASATLDRVDKLSQKIGFSRQAFQEWDYILGQSGANIEAMQSGLKTLVNRMEESKKKTGTGAEAFKMLKISATDSKGALKKQEVVFGEVISKMQKMPAGAEKSKLAFELFGKAGLELMPLLNSAGGSVDELRKKAHEMGIVFSDEAVDAGVLYGDTMDDLKKTLGAVATQVLTVFMPMIIEIAEKLTTGAAAVGKFAKEHPKLIKLIGKAVVGLLAAKGAVLGLKLGFLNARGGVLKVVEVFNKMKGMGIAGGITKIGGAFGGIVGKILPIVTVITTIIAVMKMVMGNADAIREKIRDVFGEDGVAVFDKFLGFVTMISDAVKGLFSKEGNGALGEFLDKFKEGNPVVEAFKNVFDSLMEVIPPIIEAFISFGKAVLPSLIEVIEAVIGVVSEIITTVLPVVLDLINQLLPFIKELIEIVLPILADLITTIIEVATPIIETVLPIILDLINQLLPFIQDLIEAVLPVLIEVINTIVEVISPIIDAILPVLIDLINTLSPIISDLASVFSDVLGVAIDSVKEILTGLQEVFQGVIDFVTGIFTGDWEKAWDGVVEIFGGIWDTLGALVKAPINGIITLVNKAIGGLNKLKVPDWVPVLGGKGINIPEIPLLAKGSTYTPDTFIAGEKGPELITGSAGKRVFTANQTEGILGKVKNAFQTAKEVVTNPKTVSPGLALAGVEGTSVVINSSPIFNITNGDPEDIDAKLRENNERLKREIKQELEDDAEDRRRREY